MAPIGRFSEHRIPDVGAAAIGGRERIMCRYVGRATGTTTTVWFSHSRGPVCTGGRQVNGPGSAQSRLPRICLRPPECNLSREGQNPSMFNIEGGRDCGKGVRAVSRKYAPGDARRFAQENMGSWGLYHVGIASVSRRCPDRCGQSARASDHDAFDGADRIVIVGRQVQCGLGCGGARVC